MASDATMGKSMIPQYGEIKMALGDRLQMQGPISATPRISKVVPIWEKSVNVIRE
jgi:hypothetical protein